MMYQSRSANDWRRPADGWARELATPKPARRRHCVCAVRDLGLVRAPAVLRFVSDRLAVLPRHCPRGDGQSDGLWAHGRSVGSAAVCAAGSGHADAAGGCAARTTAFAWTGSALLMDASGCGSGERAADAQVVVSQLAVLPDTRCALFRGLAVPGASHARAAARSRCA